MHDSIAGASFYLFAIPAVIMSGLSKGGLSALGALSIPILSLPILIVQDWVGVWSFRRDFDRRNLFILAPASLIGVAGAWLLAAHVSESAVRFVVGAISLGFVVFMLIRDRLPDRDPLPATLLPGTFWGATSGFTSFISHAGGPPFLVYVMPQKLPPRVFAGTSVIFFALVNLLKLPPYFFLNQFSHENLIASLALLPLGIVATYGGVWLTKRVPAERFYSAILVLSFVVGVKLVFDSLREGLF
jgi:uncharacterized membrane protein YfcA